MSISLHPETHAPITEKLSKAMCTGKSAMARAEVAMAALWHIQDRECFKVKPVPGGFQGVGRIDPAKASGVDHKAYSEAAVSEFDRLLNERVSSLINVAAE